jgi:hypothetical protein
MLINCKESRLTIDTFPNDKTNSFLNNISPKNKLSLYILQNLAINFSGWFPVGIMSKWQKFKCCFTLTLKDHFINTGVT